MVGGVEVHPDDGYKHKAADEINSAFQKAREKDAETIRLQKYTIDEYRQEVEAMETGEHPKIKALREKDAEESMVLKRRVIEQEFGLKVVDENLRLKEAHETDLSVIRGLVEALKIYGAHLGECFLSSPCICGYAEAKARAEERMKP